MHHRKYQGVTLTGDGRRQALQIERRHRIWEVFLVEKLGFDWEYVHDTAEKLEYIRANELTDRLGASLSNPQFDPHGNLIPASLGELPPTRYGSLCEVAASETVLIRGVLQKSRAAPLTFVTLAPRPFANAVCGRSQPNFCKCRCLTRNVLVG